MNTNENNAKVIVHSIMPSSTADNIGGKLGDMLAVINVLAHAPSHLSVMVIIMKNLKTLIN